MTNVPLIKRDHCAITGSYDLELLDEIKNFPVFMGCVEFPASEDVLADIIWSISRASGLIQLRNLIPLDILYPEPHGSGSVGTMWQMHH